MSRSVFTLGSGLVSVGGDVLFSVTPLNEASVDNILNRLAALTGFQVDVVTLTGTSGTAQITGAGGLTKTVTFNSDLATTASDFVTAFLADYGGCAEQIYISTDGNSILFSNDVLNTAITQPVITNLTGDLAGTVSHTPLTICYASRTIDLSGCAQPSATGLESKAILEARGCTVTLAAPQQQMETITLTGTGGSAEISAAGGLTNTINWAGDLQSTAYLFANSQQQYEIVTLTGSSGTASITVTGGLTSTVTFSSDLATTASDFVTAFSQSYLAQGICVQGQQNEQINFYAATPGVPFDAPIITNLTGDLSGTVVHDTPNSTGLDAAYAAQNIQLNADGVDLVFIANIGTTFTPPVITNLTGDLNGTVTEGVYQSGGGGPS
jgi:hypothetical protein